MIGVAEILRAVDALALPLPADGFVAKRVTEHPDYLIGRDSSGGICLLIATVGQGRTVPLRLSDIEARFSIACHVSEPDQPERTETLTAIVCTSRDMSVQGYFLELADTLIVILGDRPTLTAVADAVSQIVDMFQKLKDPAHKPIVGLVGELCLVDAASVPEIAISAWRAAQTDRFDFSIGGLRVDAKASATARRTHEVSFEQANPPPGTIGLLASVFVERTGGGTSLREFLLLLERRLSNQQAIMRMRSIVAETLGADLLRAMDWRFDLERARASLAFFDCRDIPALRSILPAGVSKVRFVSDFDLCSPLATAQLQGLRPHELGLLP